VARPLWVALENNTTNRGKKKEKKKKKKKEKETLAMASVCVTSLFLYSKQINREYEKEPSNHTVRTTTTVRGCNFIHIIATIS
jgi:hypothetical protein